MKRTLGRLLSNRRGNVAMIVAFTMIPMSIAVGMGVDYTLQKQKQDQLAGMADAAVLVAITPTMMGQSYTAAQTAAQKFWDAEAATVANAHVTGTVTVPPDIVNGSTFSRTASITWNGTYTNTFGGLLGLKSSPLSGTSSSKSANAPAINFYMVVDTSPSMGIAATTDGINTMVSNTSKQGGCAFACHESSPNSSTVVTISGKKYHEDTAGNPNGPDGTPEDNYTLSKNLYLPNATSAGIPLRIDLVNDAVTSLMNTAVSTASTYKTTYGVSISTIDYEVSQIYQTANISNNLSTAKTKIGTIQQLEVAYNNCISTSNCNGSGGGDQDSALDTALSTLNTNNATATYSASSGPGYTLNKPGNGNSASSPQEVVFIITDGVVDEASNGSRVYGPMNSLVDNCTAIKASGIRIAFLYLVYNPLPTNSWYNTYIAPFQPNIATYAKSCASPGLYTSVSTDQDVTAALTALFQAVVSTAHLSH